MGWWQWQDLRMQAADFHDIDSIATELYQAALQKLDELEKRQDQEAHARRVASKTQWEYDPLSQEEDWEGRLRLRRKQALGSLALHLLPLLSGYNPNRVNWLQVSGKSIR